MADNFQNLNKAENNSFTKGMMKDLNDSFLPEGTWTHARNATVNTLQGDMATISNESSTLFCTAAPYPVIGYLFYNDDEWIIFSTDDNTNHEIGLYKESTCTYTKIVKDPCLNFSSSNPIRSGAVKKAFDCDRYFYWDDGRNPTRYLSPTNIPYLQSQVVSPSGCVTNINTLPLTLDCDKITLAPKIKVPNVNIRKASYGGELINGSYQACVAYTINQQRFGDYYAITNPQPIFNHIGIGGSIEVSVSNLDTEYFSEFELVIVYTISGNTIAKSFGYYSTSNDSTVGISIIPDSLLTVPLSNLPVRRPVYEKSDAVYTVGDYMLRQGPKTRYSFNYQPAANNIRSKYVVWEVISNFYKNGGAVTGYMSDEVYPFFIRFLYDTGERSDSYHIPGRASTPSDIAFIPAGNGDNFDFVRMWQGMDTSVPGGNPNTLYVDPASNMEGTIIAEGQMSYWESSEQYPNDPVRYGNLCNQKIRHHKFPSRVTDPNLWHHNSTGRNIRILGIAFDNIARPRMPDPTNPSSTIDVPGIVGYEILRGSREGNRTIIAKGMFNNMLVDGKDALQNFPYNQVEQNDSLLQPANSQYASGACNAFANTASANFKRNQYYSFHSPDTQFKEPYLSPYEAKRYGVIEGELDTARFTPVENHPRHKLPSDLSFFLSAITGLIVGLKKAQGDVAVSTVTLPKLNPDLIVVPPAPGSVTTPTGGLNFLAAINPLFLPQVTIANTIYTGLQNTAGTVSQELALFLANVNLNAAGIFTNSIINPLPATTKEWIQNYIALGNILGTGFSTPETTLTIKDDPLEGMPFLVKAFYRTPLILNTWSDATDEFLELILKLVPYRQFAYQFRSHCLYNGYNNTFVNRRSIVDSGYIGSGVFNTANLRIDNTLRNKFVFLELGGTSFNDINLLTDTSRFAIGDLIWNNGTGDADKALKGDFVTGRKSASTYGAIVNRIINQYGQLDSINQIPISSNLVQVSSTSWTSSTGPMFGGDIYIGRHTEKNPFFFFRNWLQYKPDGYEIDYRKYNATPFLPRFWMDTQQFELTDFLKGFLNGIGNLIVPNIPNPLSTNTVPSDFSNLDQDPTNCTLNPLNPRLGVKNAAMYLFYSGVRDFFVETEINVDLRDWLDEDKYRNYNPYNFTDLDILFSPDNIIEREPWKYDFSLSHSKIFFDKISWGNIQPRTYDPITYLDCFTYDPNMVIYSLPNNNSVSDPWRVYLPENFKIFSGGIVNIKNINKNGSLILFNDRSPVMLQGSDALQTDLGTKVTLGDGGLFEQPLQNLTSSDLAFMEGSCIDTLGIINCAAGIYLMSNSLKKIYRVQGQGLEDITLKGMKWWFNTYMGYRILDNFPNFPDTNNLAVGIGSFISYDQEASILYFTKRDYKINPAYKNLWSYSYVSKGLFTLTSQTVPGLKLRNVKLDSKYFIDVSWTVSFDPKTDAWISFHDWHPNFTLSSRTKFTAIKGKDFWKHNVRTDSFCNFYNVDYPWEIEVPVNTQQVTVLGSVEYYLDAVVYDTSPYVSATQLYGNFDRAVVFNKEQCSGLLALTPYPINNPYLASTYPITTPGLIQTLFSKEENKYRFHQFFDIVKDRGEITGALIPIWTIGDDGYKKQLNSGALNYNKSDFQQKRIRNYLQKVFLSKNISGAVNFVFKLFSSKNIISPR